MKFVIQRVKHASVSVAGEVIGKIGRGYMVLIGACDADDEAIADKMVDKMIKLRINRDAEGKTNLSLADVDGGLLAGSPAHAEALYNYIVEKCRERVPVVQTGAFGEEMAVELLNDGPFTIILDSEKL